MSDWSYIVLLFEFYTTENIKTTVNKSYQNQQNEQWPLTSNNLTRKRPQHNRMEIQVPIWDRHNNVTGLNQSMGTQSLVITRSSMTMYM
jgi:hypothetical protein